MADTQLIRDRLDIVDFVQEYLPLKQAGSHFKTRCPFHQEKTPSFIVSRERQSWHCFGCNKGGDVFSFVQEMEGQQFIEALRLLAERAGVKLEHSARAELQTSQKNRVLDILSFAARWYHQGFLKSPRSAAARAYIEQRGVPAELAEKFMIGFVPDEWDLLTRALLKRGCGIEDCIASGLTIAGKQGSGYDRFRGRVMFPICNVHGNVVGFTGRLLEEKEDAGGKYVNTPETVAYSKGAVLYGLHLGKQAIRERKYSIVVEGQMDLIACHKAGTDNVVASSGTAFTQEQLRLLKRYANELRLAFDMDTAGVSAAIRSVELAYAMGFDVKVITVPENAGKDPDDCVQKDPEAWRRAVGDAQPFMLFLVDRAVAQARGGSAGQSGGIRDLVAALAPALGIIAVMPSAIERGYWTHVIAERTGIREDDARAEVARVQARRTPPAGGLARTTSHTSVPSAAAPIVLDMVEQRTERLLALIVRYPRPLLTEIALPVLTADSPWLAVHQALVVYYERTKPSSWQEAYQGIRTTLRDERAQQLFDRLQLLAETFDFRERDAIQEAHILSLALRTGWLERERSRLIAALKDAKQRGDHDREMALFEQLKNVK